MHMCEKLEEERQPHSGCAITWSDPDECSSAQRGANGSASSHSLVRYRVLEKWERLFEKTVKQSRPRLRDPAMKKRVSHILVSIYGIRTYTLPKLIRFSDNL